MGNFFGRLPYIYTNSATRGYLRDYVSPFSEHGPPRHYKRLEAAEAPACDRPDDVRESDGTLRFSKALL